MTEAAGVSETYGVSPTQEGMLYHGLSGAGSGVDVEQIVCRIGGAFEETAFVAAFERVIARHAILRTRFAYGQDGRPIQEVLGHAPLPVERLALAGRDAAQREASLAAWLRADRGRGVDLGEAPAMRLTLADRGDGTRIVVWTFHHALLDGRSFPLVLREVFAFHDAAIEGREIDLPLPRPYGEYIDFLGRLDLVAAASYWTRTLAGFTAPTPLTIDRDTADEDRATDVQGVHEQRLGVEATRRLGAFAGAQGVTLNTLVQAAWALLLHRYSRETEVVFGATRACRRSAFPDAGGMVGLFINTLPLRVDVDPDRKLGDFLKRVRALQVDLRQHEHTPLVKVQGWSGIERGRPLFETIVVYENRTLDATLHEWGMSPQRTFSYHGQTNYPLTLIGYGDDDMLARLENDRRRVDDAAAQRMLGHFATLLRAMPEFAERKVRELPVLTAEEQTMLAAAAAPSATFTQTRCLHERFEERVQQTPDAIAAVCEGEELTYAALNARANAVAEALIAHGVGPNVLVGIRTERSLHIVIGILGILKAGGAYLPFDPAYPKERVEFMLKDSGVDVIVTETAFAAEFPGRRLVRLDEPREGVEANPVSGASPEDLAYVIYTSGSTGKPKGARISHQNVTRLFDATEAWYRFDERDVWTLFHSYAFDFSVWEIWGALLYGGRVVVVPFWVSRSPEAFWQLVVTHGVTVLNQTPSAFRQLIQADILSGPPVKTALRHVIFGGEALELQSLRPWFERHGYEQPRLVNMYGITETTVHVTYRPITMKDLDEGAGSVIGVPIPDLGVHLLDPYGEPVPTGVPGEMYVSGAGVAAGYLRRPELTAQRFIRDPFGGDGTRYRTGDLARRRANGDLEYLGRIDDQVKIRGFRIELGEIEAELGRHPAVKEAAVLARADQGVDKRLVAYVVATGAEGIVPELQAHLRQTLPDYMVPAHFVFLPTLPLTNNGKVDRKALPAPDYSRRESEQPYVAPRTPHEIALAQVWSAVLSVPRVSVDDNFFELGGDSILTIQVIAQCRRQGLSFTPRDLARRPTIAQLAEVIALAGTGSAAEPEARVGKIAPTPIQRWFFERAFTEADHWNQAFLFAVPRNIDVGTLEQALVDVVARHDAFGLRATKAGDVWSIGYDPHPTQPTITKIDLSRTPPEDHPPTIEAAATGAQASMNLGRAPLIRAVHFGRGELDGRFLLVVHHLAIDGVSWRILVEDIESAYAGRLVRSVLKNAGGEREARGGAVRPPVLREESLPLSPKRRFTRREALDEDAERADAGVFQRPSGLNRPALSTSFGRWSEAVSRYASSERPAEALDRWLAITRVSPALAPAQPTTDPDTEGRARSTTVSLDEEQTRALLQAVPAAYKTQINDVLLTALAMTLGDVTGRDTHRVDLEGHGREEGIAPIDVSRTIGWFTTLYPVALDLGGAADPGSALRRVKEQLRAIPDRGLSYGVLRYASAEPRIRETLAGSESALLFNYLGQFDQVVAGSTLFRFADGPIGPWHGPSNQRTHRLEVIALVRNGRFEARWIHGPQDRADSVQRLAASFLAHLRGLIEHCLARRTPGLVPSDFPLARLDQPTLDRLVAAHPQIEDVYPLSPMQRLFLSMEAGGANVGFESWAFRIRGPLDRAALRAAWNDVTLRHPILRTAFVTEGGGEPLQVVERTVSLPWAEHDLAAETPERRAAAVRALARAERDRGFDLGVAPLSRINLIRIGADDHQLLWSTHHLYVDGWSWPLIIGDVAAAYRARRGGTGPDFGPACPYASYIAWLAKDAPDSKEFWRQSLAGFVSPTPLAIDPPSSGSGVHEEIVRLPRVATEQFTERARSLRVTLNTIVQGAWALVLHHLSGREDVVFGAAFSGRPAGLPGIEALVGPCVNNVPVRLTIDANQPVAAWLQSLHELNVEIGEAQYASLSDIQEWAGIPWRMRLFDSLVVFQNYQTGEGVGRLGAATVELLEAPDATNYPVTVTVTPLPQLEIKVVGQANRTSRDTVAGLAASVAAILTGLVEQRAAAVAGLRDLLPAAMRGRAAEVAAAAARSKPAAAYVPPGSAIERAVAQIWQELFQVDRVGMDDNFFDLGGHSLLLLRAHVRLRESMKPDLSIVALLQYPTIRSLARYLGNGERDEPALSQVQDRARLQREAAARARREREKR